MAVKVGEIYEELNRALRAGLAEGWHENPLLPAQVAMGRPGNQHRAWSLDAPSSVPRDGRRRLRSADLDGTQSDHAMRVLFAWGLPVSGEKAGYQAALNAETEIWTALATSDGSIVGAIVPEAANRFYLGSEGKGPSTLVVELRFRVSVLTTLVNT